MHDSLDAQRPVIVTMPQAVDAGNSGAVGDTLDAAFAQGATAVVADCTLTTFCDSIGFNTLLLTDEKARAAEAELLFVIAPNSPLRRVLELLEMQDELAVYPSIDDAVAASGSLLATRTARSPASGRASCYLWRYLLRWLLPARAESESLPVAVIPVRTMLGAGVALSAALSGAHGASPASAGPRYQLTFNVIDRSGHLVKPLDLQLLNLATGNNIDLGQGTKIRVSSGRYNVAGWIGTGTGPQSFTLADQIVRVTRNRTITLDARLGQRVRIRLDSPDAVDELIELAPIVKGDWAFNPSFIADSVNGGTLAAPAYVVPMTSRLVILYEYSVWEKRGNTVSRPSPFRYDIIKVYRGGLPSNPTIAVRTSDLARVSVTVRATDQNQQATLEFQPMGGPVSTVPLDAGTSLGATPARLVSYRSPGYSWQPIVGLTSPSGGMRDFVLNMRPYSRGHFTEHYFTAVLSPPLLNGPSAEVDGRRLGAASWPLLSDPWNEDTSDVVTGMTGLLRLYSGHRLLAKSHLDMYGYGTNLNARIPMARHWYTLYVDATRPSGAVLSTQIHGVWRFYAHGTTNGAVFQAHLDAIRLLPSGLDLRNQAGANALTRVSMRVLLNGYPSIAIRVARAYASFDGTSWRAVRVRALGGHYIFAVRDPRQAGFVSLRVYIRDAAGDSEWLTVIHAYGVR